MSFEPSIVRRSLDYLLDAYPSFDLVSIDWQAASRSTGAEHTGPWVLVTLGQPSDAFDEMPAWSLWRFAIFKRTGALHTMEPPAGPVSDDPIWTPQ